MGLKVQAKKETAKKSTKKEYLKVHPSSISQDDYYELLSEQASAEKEFKTIKAKVDSLKDETNDIGFEEWVNLYQKTGVNPSTFMLEAIDKKGNVAQTMFLPTDKYGSLTEETAGTLTDKFGKEVVVKTESYSINPTLVDKYATVFEKFFNECEDFDEADRPNLLVLKESYSVAKGFLDKMANIPILDEEGEETSEKYEVIDVAEAVKPVAYCKGTTVIKS